MRATSPAGDARYEGEIQWTADLGAGLRAAEGGQSENRNDEATGSKLLRRAFAKHVLPEDMPLDMVGLRGKINELKAKRPSKKKVVKK